MTLARNFFARLSGDRRGSMAIETALIAPLLVLMSLGVFDISNIIAKEQRLQSAANEATEILLAAAGGTGVTDADLETILESSIGLNAQDLTITKRYRCGTGSLVTAQPTCASGVQKYTYNYLAITSSYTPLWTKFGVGSTFNYTVNRMVQVS